MNITEKRNDEDESIGFEENDNSSNKNDNEYKDIPPSEEKRNK